MFAKTYDSQSGVATPAKNHDAVSINTPNMQNLLMVLSRAMKSKEIFRKLACKEAQKKHPNLDVKNAMWDGYGGVNDTVHEFTDLIRRCGGLLLIGGIQ